MAQTYLPLYRKYRPQTFKDLIGQENIVKALSNAINLNKISHAYLLCGPRGTGKTTTARIIAKSLNCANGPTLEPCGECPSCKDIANSTPIDVIEIDAASNRKVEDARNILEKIQFVPVNGRYKIYIIDEVHMLTPEAFNTLLKTLEEPPENVIFILATTEPHKVLDTIISRCQRFDFRRITTEDIVSRLKYISEQENIKITEDALYTIARSSQGGMRDSLALLDQISVLDAEKEITADDVNDLLGRLSFDVLCALSETITDSKAQEALSLLDNIYNKGNEPFQIVSNLIQYFRNLLVVKNCADRNIAAELTQLSEAHILKLKEQSQNIEPEQIIYTIERLAFYSKEIKETTNRYLWLELCLIELSSNVKYCSYSQLLERIEKLEAGITSNPAGNDIPLGNSVFKIPVPNVVLKKEEKKEFVDERHNQTAAPIAETTGEILEEKQETKEVAEIQHQKPQSESTIVEQTQTDSKISQAQSVSTDTAEVWQGILQNIESIPSRMFFFNLSRPVSLSKDCIEIAFMKDIFVKQAKEDSKNAPLKKAAMKYFGVDNINIQIKLADTEFQDAKDIKPALKKLEKKDVEPKSASVSPSFEEENAAMLNEEMSHLNVDENTPQTKTSVPDDLSDQSKMVMELFNGKYID